MKNKDNKVSRTCKTTAIIIFFLALISGAILLGELGTGMIGTIVPFWITSFIGCLVLYAIGEIISQAIVINENLKQHSQNMERCFKKILSALPDNNQADSNTDVRR